MAAGIETRNARSCRSTRRGWGAAHARRKLSCPMPLAASDGPTIYDAATAVVAVAGLLLSGYSVRRQVKRDTRSVKVICRHSFAVGPIAAVAPESMVTVEVLNDGHRPVEVTQVGFQLKDGRQPLIMPLPLEGPVSFPQTLSDGASSSFYFDYDQLEQVEAEAGQRIHRAFVAASGKRHVGAFVKR